MERTLAIGGGGGIINGPVTETANGFKHNLTAANETAKILIEVFTFHRKLSCCTRVGFKLILSRFYPL